MTRNLKALGLALLAAFAMSAVAASSASAVKEFHSDIEPTVLTGTDTPGTTSEFEIPGEEPTTCAGNHYEGTVATKTAKEITIEHTVTTPCDTGGITTHVAFNGCHYVFTLEEGIFNTAGGTTHTRGPAHIVCPAGQSITLEITVPIFADCIVHIGAQTPTIPTVDYTNQGAGTTRDVEVVSTIKGIAYTVTGGGVCPASGHDAIFRANVTVQGFTDKAGTKYQHDNVQHAVWIE